MKTLLAIAFLATTMGTAYAAPVPTPRPCHKILWLFGKNCYQPGGEVLKDHNDNRGGGNGRGAVSRSQPSAPVSSPPASSPRGEDAPSVASNGGGNVNPLGGGGAGGNPPAGDDPGSGGPGLGNPGNDKARGRAGENPGGHDFGPTGSRGRNH